MLNKKTRLNERQKVLRAEKRLKKRLEKEADDLWHIAGIKKWGNVCFFQNSPKKAKAHRTHTNTGHHYFRKGLYPQLRYDLDNFVPACWPCHYKMEKIDNTMLIDVGDARGKKWYSGLKKKSKELKPSFQTVQYYEDVIKKLEQI